MTLSGAHRGGMVFGFVDPFIPLTVGMEERAWVDIK